MSVLGTTALAQGSAISFELHTNSVRARIPLAPKDFQSGKYTCRNHVCGLAVAGGLVVSQAYPGILAFLHLRQPSNEDVEVSIDKIVTAFINKFLIYLFSLFEGSPISKALV